MKKVLVGILVVLGIQTTAIAQTKKKNTKETATKTAVNTKEIEWINLDELQKRMKIKPKKVLMDIYTNWCGWCKVMDQKTFSNPGVIKYVNEHYYAVKFNAEQTDTVHFMGSSYGMEGRTNQFAVQLLRGQMSYPTIVIMEENFQNPQPVPGYQDVKNMEMILKYMGGNVYKTTTWDEYTKTAQTTWEQNATISN